MRERAQATLHKVMVSAQFLENESDALDAVRTLDAIRRQLYSSTTRTWRVQLLGQLHRRDACGLGFRPPRPPPSPGTLRRDMCPCTATVGLRRAWLTCAVGRSVGEHAWRGDAAVLC